MIVSKSDFWEPLLFNDFSHENFFPVKMNPGSFSTWEVLHTIGGQSEQFPFTLFLPTCVSQKILGTGGTGSGLGSDQYQWCSDILIQSNVNMNINECMKKYNVNILMLYIIYR